MLSDFCVRDPPWDLLSPMQRAESLPETLQIVAWNNLWLPNEVRYRQWRLWGSWNPFAAFPSSVLSSEAPSLCCWIVAQRHPLVCWATGEKRLVPPSADPGWGVSFSRPFVRAVTSCYCLVPRNWAELGKSGLQAPNSAVSHLANVWVGFCSQCTKPGSKRKVSEGSTASRGKAGESFARELKASDF